MQSTLYCIGAGRVTRIILEGLAKKNTLPDRIIITDTSSEVRDNLSFSYPMIEAKSEIDTTISESDFILIGLHPPAVVEMVQRIAPFLSEKNTLVSLAPKVNSETLMELTDRRCPVIRMIPNAPSYVNTGYNPVWYSATCPDIVKQKFSELMSPLGDMPEVPEKDLEAYAVITAMGPTYLWFQLAELIRLGESFGLSSEESSQAVLSMTAGAVKIMQDSNLSQAEVLDLVPVKPLADHEEAIREMYTSSLSGMYGKLTT